jgi:hypothetical protein
VSLTAGSVVVGVCLAMLFAASLYLSLPSHSTGPASERPAASAREPGMPSDAERKHRWDSCRDAQGIPVMGFDYVIVCVDGAHVLAIDGKKF